MPQSFKRYVAALLVLGSLSAIYQFTFVLWLEPNPVEPIEFAQTYGTGRNEALASIYPSDAWQLGNCKRLQTRDGALLFENWQQIGDDQWKLWPLSVVLGTTGDTPLIIDAPEGAEIKFAESLDMMSGGAPPIERGRMIGQVRIRSVGKAFPLGADGTSQSPVPEGHLEIVSSDFGIDFRKIWTTQPITVKIGDIKLAGRDLTLHLAPMGRIQAGGEGPMSILNRMELIYLDELTVPLPKGGLWRSGDAAKLAADPESRIAGAPPLRRLPVPGEPAPPPAVAKLRCAGRVVFQFSSNELTLRDRVMLEHRTPEAIDLFECETLKMQFADLLNPTAKLSLDDPLARFIADSASITGNAQPGKPPIAQQQIDDYLLSVVAEGRPARMRLPSFAAEVAAERIQLDARVGLLRMSGRAGARISYAGHTWRFKEFTYQLNPTDPKKIGAFDASGSGLVEFAVPSELPIRRLRWSDGIKLEQPGDDGQFTIRVDGDVSALMTDDGEFSTDSAMVVMKTGDSALAGDDWLRSTKPVRFQATGNVVIESPMVNVATKLLRLYFDFDEATQSRSTAIQAGSSGAETTIAAHPLRQWVRQPTGDAAIARNDSGGSTRAIVAGAATPIRGPRPLLRGDTINAKLRLTGTDLTASDLTVVGDVILEHTLETTSGPMPAVMTGQRLQLRDTAGNEILQIGSGVDSPARLTLGDGFFIGPLIQVRLADNLVWIKDAGEFQIPSQMLPQVAAASPEFEPIDDDPAAANRQLRSQPTTAPQTMKWIAAPRCRWRGQMLFDGSRVALSDGVDIRGAVMVGQEQDVWDFDVIGDQLEVVLASEVKMRDPDSMRAATVEHVRLIASQSFPLVITVNQLTSRGVRKGRHILTLPELTMRPETSMVSGMGPGWYRAWIQNDGGSLSSAVTSGGFRPSEPTLTGLHLVFKELLEANINTQSLDFLGGVRIAGRAVKAWDDVIDAEAIQGLRLGESTLDCDRLRLAIDQTDKRMLNGPPWEMEAIGSVVYHTRNDRGLFNGTADRASYTAAKDTFLIAGEPGRSATMNQTLPTGAAGTSAAVKRLSVNTRTMEVINVEFDRLQLGTLPNFSSSNK